MLDDSALPLVADRVSQTLGLHLFVVGWRDAHGRFRSIASSAYDEATARGYDTVSDLDIWFAALAGETPRRSYASEALAPLAELERSAFYNEYLRRFVGRDMVHGWLATLGSEIEEGTIGGVRSRRAGEFGESEIAAADALLPHFQRLVAVRRHMAEQPGAGRATEVLDVLTSPVVATDAGGRILYMNSDGERLLNAGDCLAYGRDGGLSAAHPEDAEQLRAALAAACRDVSGTVFLRRPGGGRPLAAVVASSHAVSQKMHALVLVNEPGARINPAWLKQIFGLSSAEADVAVSLATGKTLEDIAEERGVAVSTLRVQLKAIYAKTATKRQAELVSLIVGLRRFDVT